MSTDTPDTAESVQADAEQQPAAPGNDQAQYSVIVTDDGIHISLFVPHEHVIVIDEDDPEDDGLADAE